jgi:Bacterial regulatory helix-turn-helix protein, lysR family
MLDNWDLRMDRLGSLTAFLRVAESGGFTAAARGLNLSTTRVSEQVQRWSTLSACAFSTVRRGGSA